MNRDELKAAMRDQWNKVNSIGASLSGLHSKVTNSAAYKSTLGSRLGKSLYRRTVGKALRDPLDNPAGGRASLAVLGSVLSNGVASLGGLPRELQDNIRNISKRTPDRSAEILRNNRQTEGEHNAREQDRLYKRSKEVQANGGQFKDLNGNKVSRSSSQSYQRKVSKDAAKTRKSVESKAKAVADFNSKYSNYGKHQSDRFKSGSSSSTFTPHSTMNSVSTVGTTGEALRTNKQILDNGVKAKRREEILSRSRQLRSESTTSLKTTDERNTLRNQAYGAVRDARSNLASNVGVLSQTRQPIDPTGKLYRVTNPSKVDVKAPLSPAIRTSFADAISHANSLDTPNTGGSLLSKAWEGFKDFTRPVWGDKTDREADKVTRAFTGLGYDQGVKGFTPNLDGISNLSESDRNALVRGNTNEAAKHVRTRGANVDPFLDSQESRKEQRRFEKANEIRTNKVQENLSNERAALHTERMNMARDFVTDPTQPIRGDIGKINHRIGAIETRMNRNQKILDYKGTTEYGSAKSFRPSEGVNGYGLGFANHMRASRGELATRGFGFLTGTGGGEALMNSFGVRTAIQKAEMKRQTGVIKKLLTPGGQALAGTFGSLLYTASTGGDVSDFVSTQVSYAAGLQGWRVGASFGGALGQGYATGGQMSAKGVAGSVGRAAGAGLGRGALTVAGGVTGFALGLAAVQGATWMAQDLVSNQSSIRKVAKEFTTRTATINTADNYKTLTSRQAALNKLAKSGLNDRAILLGNEARVLKGLM